MEWYCNFEVTKANERKMREMLKGKGIIPLNYNYTDEIVNQINVVYYGIQSITLYYFYQIVEFLHLQLGTLPHVLKLQMVV